MGLNFLKGVVCLKKEELSSKRMLFKLIVSLLGNIKVNRIIYFFGDSTLAILFYKWVEIEDSKRNEIRIKLHIFIKIFFSLNNMLKSMRFAFAYSSGPFNLVAPFKQFKSMVFTFIIYPNSAHSLQLLSDTSKL